MSFTQGLSPVVELIHSDVTIILIRPCVLPPQDQVPCVVCIPCVADPLIIVWHQGAIEEHGDSSTGSTEHKYTVKPRGRGDVCDSHVVSGWVCLHREPVVKRKWSIEVKVCQRGFQIVLNHKILSKCTWNHHLHLARKCWSQGHSSSASLPKCPPSPQSSSLGWSATWRWWRHWCRERVCTDSAPRAVLSTWPIDVSYEEIARHFQPEDTESQHLLVYIRFPSTKPVGSTRISVSNTEWCSGLKTKTQLKSCQPTLPNTCWGLLYSSIFARSSKSS